MEKKIERNVFRSDWKNERSFIKNVTKKIKFNDFTCTSPAPTLHYIRECACICREDNENESLLVPILFYSFTASALSHRHHPFSELGATSSSPVCCPLFLYLFSMNPVHCSTFGFVWSKGLKLKRDCERVVRLFASQLLSSSICGIRSNHNLVNCRILSRYWTSPTNGAENIATTVVKFQG